MNSKKSKGKQKLEIKKIEKYENRMVTLSKRRDGIYTKLSELSILCGADVGFLVYSYTGKPYTFGSPSFEAVAERFLNGHGSPSSSVVDLHRKAKIEELCKLYTTTVEKAEAEEKIRVTMTAAAQSSPVEKDSWWKIDPTVMKDEEEATQLMGMYEKLYEKLREEIARRGGDASSSK